MYTLASGINAMLHLAAAFSSVLYSFDNGMTYGGLIVGGIVGVSYAVSIAIKKFMTHRKRDKLGKSLISMTKFDREIQGLLTEARLANLANRIMIMQFHNGDHFFSGTPIQKVMCTHESVSMGYASIGSGWASAPVSLMAPMISIMIEHKDETHLVKDMVDSYAKYELTTLGVHSFAIVPLHTSPGVGFKDQAIGYLCLHWMGSPPPPCDSAQVWDKLHAVSHSIEFLLENQNLSTKE